MHFGEFHERYAPLFQQHSRVAGEKSLQYFKGLIQAKKKNMERMAEAVPFSDDQALQHFLTNSEWDEQLIVDQIAIDANNYIGGKRDSCLIIDETGFPKKGDKSVGVKRQWCGQLGKVDNCQVGVFSALGYREHATPVGFKLYLPEDWVDVLHKLVWLWDGEESEAHCWHLIVRREVTGSKVKFSLSNAPENTSLER